MTSEPHTIDLIPKPGTPAYENMRQWMRQAWADPRNVAFRAQVWADEGTMAFLTQGGGEPLPMVTDPIQGASEVVLHLLLRAPGNMSEDDLTDSVEEFLRGCQFHSGYITVIDVLITDGPRAVNVLDARHYRPGDHFTNPLPAQLTDTEPDPEPEVNDEPPADVGTHPGAIIREYDE